MLRLTADDKVGLGAIYIFPVGIADAVLLMMQAALEQSAP